MRAAARQEQFLEVVSAEEARARFEAHLDLRAAAAPRRVALAAALGRVLAARSSRRRSTCRRSTAPTSTASRCAPPTPPAPSDAAPKQLALNAEVIACGHAPTLEVAPGTATTIATGGVMPRGADAVVMIEHTELIEQRARRSSCAAPSRRASSSPTPAPTSRAARRCCARASAIGSREIGMLAACGLADVDVVRRPKVAVLSTGDELVALGEPLRPGGVYDSNGAIIAAAIAEAGGEPVPFGAFPDDDDGAGSRRCARRSAECDMVVLSGGTSKGAGDLSHRVVSRLGKPGILVHGVALKPGKPLCLAVADGKPIVVLPGFPTSAIFTFHAFVAPVIRARAGLPPEAAQTVDARVPVRIASEIGRKEFVLVSLVEGEDGAVAFPVRQGLRRGDELLAGRRLHRDRRAGRRARRRHARRASR